MSDARLEANPQLKAAKRFMGKLTSLSDLPSDSELIAFIHEAMALNDKGGETRAASRCEACEGGRDRDPGRLRRTAVTP